MVKLGSMVTDSITGFSGVAIGRCEYLYGCVRVQVQSCDLKEGKVIDTEWFDEQRLGEFEAKSGGPQSAPPSRDPK